MLRTAIAKFYLGPHRRKQLARGLDVAHLRNIFQDHRFVGEQGSSHRREGGIFCSTDANRAQERVSAANYEFIHSKRISKRNCGKPRASYFILYVRKRDFPDLRDTPVTKAW